MILPSSYTSSSSRFTSQVKIPKPSMGDDNGMLSNLEGILLPHSWICEADTKCDKTSQRDLREVKNLYVLTMFSLHAWDIFISHTHEKNPSHISPYPIRSRKNILCPRPATFGYLGMMSIHSIIELLKTSGVAMIYPYIYIILYIYTYWLVVSTPLKNMKVS